MMTLDTICVADGDGLARIGLKAVLAEGGFHHSIVEATDFTGIRAQLSKGQASLAIIDIHLPGLGGTSGLQKLREHYPDLKVCVLFDVVTREIVSRFLEFGVMGFVAKSCTAAEITEAAAALLRGRPYLSKLGEAEDLSNERQMPASNLTQQQRKVLTVMATGKSNKEIARELGICEGTVKVHVNAAYRALGVHNRVAAVTMLRDSGNVAFAA